MNGGGRERGDRYAPVRLIGEGGAGRVWLVRDRDRSGELCALKELPAASKAHEDQLRQEFATLAALRHPNLVEVHALDTSPSTGLPRFTLEYVDGVDIVTAVAREGPELCLDVAAEALRALAFLGDFGLVHRDLKPGNLLVRRQARLGCRLAMLDFGLALHENRPEGPGPAGTLPYLAPEILEGAQAGPRSDLYALGAVLHEAVHGRPPFPFDDQDLTGFVARVRAGERPVLALPAGYPAGFGEWMEALLARDPVGRPAGATEALARLHAATGRIHHAETAAGRAARLASGTPPGRDREVAAVWEAIAEEGPRLIWLCGGPGTGKTRLLRWLSSEGVVRGWDVTMQSAGEGSAPRKVGTASAVLASLRGRAEDHPTLLLLDEVEVGSTTESEILERVAREGKAAPLKVVAAARAGEMRQPAMRRLMEETGIVPTLRRVDLQPLDGAGVRAMAERATGARDVSQARARWLLQLSEGSPLVCASLLVDGTWERHAKPGRVSSLERATEGRLALLTAEGLAWLEALCVAGEGSEGGVIERLCGLEPSRVREAAAEVAAAGLAQERAGLWSPDSRALAAQVRGALDRDRGRAMHSAAARLVSQSSTPDPWRLARLWSAAGERDLATEHAVRAAQAAERQGDPAEAAERLGFALRQLRRSDPRRRALRLRQGDARMEAGLHQAAARSFGSALRLSSKDKALRTSALARQARALALAGRFELAQVAAERAEKLARSLGLRVEQAQAQRALGIVLARQGRLDESLAVLERTVPLARSLGDPHLEAEILHSLAACKGNLRRPDAESAYQGALEAFDRCGDEHGKLKCLFGLASTDLRQRRLDKAREKFESLRTLALEQDPTLAHLTLMNLAALAHEHGEIDRALSLSIEAGDLAVHLGDRNLVLLSRSLMAEALIACGRLAEAIQELSPAIAKSAGRVEPDHLDYARMVLAQALLEESPGREPEAAPTLLETAITSARERRKRRPLIVGLSWEMERRSRIDCKEPFDPVRMEFDALVQGSETPVDTEILVRADLAKAASLFHRGNFQGARQAAADALATAESAGAPFHAARALSLLSEVYEALADQDEASRTLERGRRYLQEAAERIEDVSIRKDFLARPIFRRLSASTAGPRRDRKLEILYDMIRIVNSQSDPDALLESILDLALNGVRAERGMILLKPPGEDDFSVRLSRNLERETRKDAEAFSRGIASQAGAGTSVLALDAEHDDRFRDLKSVSLYGIRSLMCVPLRSRGRIVGTVYLDSRRDGALFTQDDLKFVEAFADHAALALENAGTRADLERENRRLQVLAESRVQFGNMAGRSPGMQKVFDLVEKTAASQLPVLVLGESGTGKELVARAIHLHGPRRRKIFLSENCAAIPESLLETTLFGHTRGAFTGAERDKPGLFEQADKGTLFLDEVGDMSLGMQASLLRALQYGEIRRVGGEKTLHVDVRILAATHRDLHAQVAAGRFREDLLYRLQVLVVQIPPIREREGDIPLLVSHLLERIARERGRPVPRMDRRLLEMFERYTWPGNVRQLENALQRLVLVAGDGPITTDVLDGDPQLKGVLMPGQAQPEVRFSLQRTEKEQIRQALEAARGNRDRAAQMLGISRATIYRKINEHRLR